MKLPAYLNDRLDKILTINGGSSSIKFALFEGINPIRSIVNGEIDRIGLPNTTLRISGPQHGSEKSQNVKASNHSEAAVIVTDWITNNIGSNGLSAVGHRLVQGGPRYWKPLQLNSENIEELKKLGPFDPEHLPGEMLLIDSFYRRFPNLSHFACFDTAFHHDLPRVSQMLTIPRRYEAKGLRRYGFHGLSYQFLMEELNRLKDAAASKGRVILAHLGNGSSLAAILDGKSIDTSMGFTPSSGVTMSTRTGDLDPGLAWYLRQTEKMDAKDFNDMVCFQSGLLGISETSSDMHDLLERETRDIRAAEAIAIYCYQVKKWIGSFVAALGGLDTLVFSGGIGENAPAIRSRICENLKCFGIELEPTKNVSGKGVISSTGSTVMVRAIHTDEEKVIAQTISQILKFSSEKGELHAEYKNAVPGVG
jgi:acetate kinase